MTAARVIWIECDAKGADCHGDSTDGSIAGGASENTTAQARRMARDIGWHRSGNRDICPWCWDEVPR